MRFVHLRVHTEFSLTDGTLRIEPPKRKGGGQGATVISRAAEYKMPALAVTERGNLFSFVKFYKAAEGAGIKPICGADILVGEGDALPTQLTLLAMNAEGYAQLCAGLSQSFLQGQGRHGTVTRPTQWEDGSGSGLIALAGPHSALGRALLAGDVEAAEQHRAWLTQHFGQRCYLEVMRCDRPGDEDWVQLADAYGRLHGLPLVATNDVRFLAESDFDAHEARVCIATGRVLDDPKRPRDYSPQQYLKSPQEMAERFADLPDALANTLEIAERCSFALSLGVNHLPNFPVPEGHSTHSWLRAESERGLRARLAVIPLCGPESGYWERLDFELATIERMGFAGYFLTVADFIQWAKDNGCPVGPGRGSGAGSLVAYALKITDLDPIPYDLLFERFLNPERVSMPDFDIDFCMDNRDRVIAYVAQKYGRPYVGQIVTYNTMAAKGVVRDVTRILGHGFGFGDRIAKLIPATPGATLLEAVEGVPELKQMYEGEEDVAAVLDMALSLEGITRGVGVHAGGVVIAPQPLATYAPLYCDSDGSGVRTQFDMKDLETIGLVKFDFLGLKTLTVIEEALQTIARSSGKKIDMLGLGLDDEATYKTYASGKTGAVFQMESPGMQRASMDLKPDCFEDIIALVSLYRPGPMDLIPSFCARKRGDEKVEYLHPEMEPVLKPTYGIFVYQEQVMQMSQRLAGYTLGGADMLRRAMGKKIREEMEKQRGVFTQGAIGRGVDGDVAGKVFDLMEKFANYGFNKSHAAAYALVSYHTAWLKTHYPAEFMAAVMSCEMAHPDSVVAMRDEALRMGLTVQPPCINQSSYRFTVPKARTLAYGLGAVKGVGEGAVEAMLAARDAGGPFLDLFDFCRRIDLKKANKKVMEALIFSGSLDCLGLHRAALLKNLPRALAYAESVQSSALSGQNDLFSSGPVRMLAPPEPEKCADMPFAERLAKEFETLGFYLSGHPMEVHKALIEAVCSARLPQILANLPAPAKPNAQGKTAWQPRPKHLFAGWVTDIRFFKPKEGAVGAAARASYKVNLSDGDALITTFVDASRWDEWRDFVKVDELVFVEAEVSMGQREGREPEPRLNRAEFYAPGKVAAEYATRMHLDFVGGASEVLSLHQLLKGCRTPEGHPLQVLLRCGRVEVLMDFPDTWKVKPDAGTLTALRALLGADAVKMQYRRYIPPVTERKFGKREFAASVGDEE